MLDGIPEFLKKPYDKVAFILFDDSYLNEIGIIKNSVGHENIIRIQNTFGSDTELSVDINIALQTELARQISGNDRLEECAIFSHGYSHNMQYDDPNTDIKEFFSIKKLLIDLSKDGKVPKNIEFLGCNTFSNMSEEDIQFYKNFAKKNDTNLTGTTTSGAALKLGIEGINANMVTFTCDGKVIRTKNGMEKHPDIKRDNSGHALKLELGEVGTKEIKDYKNKRNFMERLEEELDIKFCSLLPKLSDSKTLFIDKEFSEVSDFETFLDNSDISFQYLQEKLECGEFDSAACEIKTTIDAITTKHDMISAVALAWNSNIVSRCDDDANKAMSLQEMGKYLDELGVDIADLDIDNNGIIKEMSPVLDHFASYSPR